MACILCSQRLTLVYIFVEDVWYMISYNTAGVSSDYAQPITGQVTEVTYPVIGGTQPELTLSKRQKTGNGKEGRRAKWQSREETNQDYNFYVD